MTAHMPPPTARGWAKAVATLGRPRPPPPPSADATYPKSAPHETKEIGPYPLPNSTLNKDTKRAIKVATWCIAAARSDKHGIRELKVKGHTDWADFAYAIHFIEISVTTGCKKTQEQRQEHAQQQKREASPIA